MLTVSGVAASVEVVRNYYLEEYSKGSSILNRMKLVRRYGFAIPNQEAVDVVRSYGQVDELGAGSGYWAWLCGNVRPFDICPAGRFDRAWMPITVGGVECLTAETVLVCWPEGDMMTQLLDSFQGRRMIYVGEWNGCCSYDPRMDSDWKFVKRVDIPQWDCINDYMVVLER